MFNEKKNHQLMLVGLVLWSHRMFANNVSLRLFKPLARLNVIISTAVWKLVKSHVPKSIIALFSIQTIARSTMRPFQCKSKLAHVITGTHCSRNESWNTHRSCHWCLIYRIIFKRISSAVSNVSNKVCSARARIITRIIKWVSERMFWRRKF